MAVIARMEDAALRLWCRWTVCPHPVSTEAMEDPEEGSTTVEYAIGAIATAGFAGLLLAVLKSGAIRSALQGIIQSALTL